MTYEKLQKEAAQKGIDIYEEPMNIAVKGLYGNNTIWINKGLSTITEKTCTFAEELGHYHTSIGDILDQSNLQNYKQEKIARTWAYERLIPLPKIVQAYHAGVSSRYELAAYLEVTEDFLDSALKRYQEKYGLYVTYDGYKITFNPLNVILIYE